MKLIFSRRTQGFSVVELMVSVVVGMVAVMLATRLMVNSETQKSSALGSSDTMQNGMLAMFQINTDAAQAGWGLNDDLVAGCNTLMQDAQGFALATVQRGGIPVTPLAPVVIQSNGENSDEISLYSGSALSGVGNVGLGADYNGGDSLTTTVQNPFGFAAGDVVLVAPEPAGADCSLAQLSQLPAGTNLRISGGNNTRFNGASLLGGTYRQGQTRIYNLGRPDKLSFHTWSVRNGMLLLRATDLAGTSQNPQTVIDNVIAIKAQYGLDMRASNNFDAASLQLDRWSPAMIDADQDGVAGSAGDFQRIAAVRIAVVARGAMPEKPDPRTGLCKATTGPLTIFQSDSPVNVPAVPVQVKLSVAGDAIDWTCYRYRAFETIVPIRNSGWRP